MPANPNIAVGDPLIQWPPGVGKSNNRLIFDIAGNKYRLIVHVAYAYKRVLVKFVGTHAEYDKIDPEAV